MDPTQVRKQKGNNREPTSEPKQGSRGYSPKEPADLDALRKNLAAPSQEGGTAVQKQPKLNPPLVLQAGLTGVYNGHPDDPFSPKIEYSIGMTKARYGTEGSKITFESPYKITFYTLDPTTRELLKKDARLEKSMLSPSNETPRNDPLYTFLDKEGKPNKLTPIQINSAPSDQQQKINYNIDLVAPPKGPLPNRFFQPIKDQNFTIESDYSKKDSGVLEIVNGPMPFMVSLAVIETNAHTKAKKDASATISPKDAAIYATFDLRTLGRDAPFTCNYNGTKIELMIDKTGKLMLNRTDPPPRESFASDQSGTDRSSSSTTSSRSLPFSVPKWGDGVYGGIDTLQTFMKQTFTIVGDTLSGK